MWLTFSKSYKEKKIKDYTVFLYSIYIQKNMHATLPNLQQLPFWSLTAKACLPLLQST